MIRKITFFFMLLLNGNFISSSFCQEVELETSISLESHILEYYQTGKGSADGTYNYCGQTFSGSISYFPGHHWGIGGNMGIYYHQRKGIGQANIYAYLPMQLNVRFHTINKRFQAEISSGYPVKLHAYKPYIGTGGFWYRDADPNSGNFQYDTIQTRSGIHLISNLRFKFCLDQPHHWYLTTGIRHLLYTRKNLHYTFEGVGYIKESGPYSYFNYSIGLEYRF
jgi:hypothetical protein